MKFAIGYQLPEIDEEPILDVISDYQDHIAEVYFPWIDMPSGRAILNQRRGFVNWKSQSILEHDLDLLKQKGIKLDILFNANCYGGIATSQFLMGKVYSILEHLQETIGGIDIVTTTSLAIAKMVKTNFPEIEVRASINMRIGTIKGMQYVADLFDSFYMQREYNRDFTTIKKLKQWSEENNKKLLLLANSGCLNFCSGQTFHDNMVAHEIEIDEYAKIPNWNPHVCWNYYKDADNRVFILQNSWIRPEDIHHYEPYFSVMKLATRMHANPRMVIQAYVEQKYYGNLLNLFEPGFGPLFAPTVIDNTRFPQDWFTKTTECNKECYQCNYCTMIFEQVVIK